MGLNVGTLVQPFDPDEASRTCFKDGKTDECVGIIVMMDNSSAKVRWVQVCPNHLELLTTVDTHMFDQLWQIGELY